MSTEPDLQPAEVVYDKMTRGYRLGHLYLGQQDIEAIKCTPRKDGLFTTSLMEGLSTVRGRDAWRRVMLKKAASVSTEPINPCPLLYCCNGREEFGHAEKRAKAPTRQTATDRSDMGNLRSQISAILVKWHMPTRQAAISAIMQLITKEAERIAGERDRKTLETVAAMTGGGSSAQAALDTIQFYCHNKLLVLNDKLPKEKPHE